MGKKSEEIAEDIQEFIKAQKLFFVSTAAKDGRMNVSPKGMDSFRVIDGKTIVWLNLTGNGNETAADLLLNNRMTIMFCAFEGKPLILRLYGSAQIYHYGEPNFDKFSPLFPEHAGARQIIEMAVELVHESCGYAVPLMDYTGDRTQLKDWAKNRGQDKIEDYWQEKNTTSLDGLNTGMPK
ncbi:MAG: pyridoxamine 5'-phosphate oxidase family protein [Flavobacteriales bacterium]|nr:pyridoxamine 5'-phosphate oxidase family protein [Flavobacteriales bacterium]